MLDSDERFWKKVDRKARKHGEWFAILNMIDEEGLTEKVTMK